MMFATSERLTLVRWYDSSPVPNMDVKSFLLYKPLHLHFIACSSSLRAKPVRAYQHQKGAAVALAAFLLAAAPAMATSAEDQRALVAQQMSDLDAMMESQVRT